MKYEAVSRALRWHLAGARRERCCAHAGGFTLSVFVDIRQLCRLVGLTTQPCLAGALDVLAKPLKANIQCLPCRRHRKSEEMARQN